MGKQLHKRLKKEFVEEVLIAFNEKKMSEREAVELLGIKRTRLYCLRKRWLRNRIKGEEFKLYNRAKYLPRRFPEGIEKYLHQEMSYIRDGANRYRKKFNFSFLSEEIEKRYKIKIHRNSIRRWAIREGYYEERPEEVKKVKIRFEMSGIGELYQHDSSQHIWLPLTKKYQKLILTIDDYSRRIVGSLLVEKETSWAHICVVRATIKRYGLPLAYYVDKHSIFKFCEHKGVHVKYIKGEDEGEIQFRRVLEELEIGIIYANSPEAKGKIEKIFDYFQRRLPYLCEKYKVKDIKEANRILKEDLIPYYNEKRKHEETGEIPVKRWRRAVREGKVKLRRVPSGLDLETIFSLQYRRLVKKDGTIQFIGRKWKIGKFPGEIVTVCLIPEREIIILKGNEKIREYRL